MQMQEIKDRVTKVLDNKGVLARLKAELRANVFLAINDQDIQQGGIGLGSKSDAWHRDQLLSVPSGAVVVELVREFLTWCNLQFTQQVFEPEMQLQHAAQERHVLQQQLGLLRDDNSMPLLLQLLQQYSALAQQLGDSPGPPSSYGSPPAMYSSLQQHAASNQPLIVQPDGHSQQAGPAGQLAPPHSQVAAAVSAGTHVANNFKQPSKSASIMEEIDEDLMHSRLQNEPQEEEYADVFLAAHRPTEGSVGGHEEDASSTASTPQQQMARPGLHWGHQPQPASAASFEQQVIDPVAAAETIVPAAIIAPPAPEPSDSFGYLDRSPEGISLELHGLDDSPLEQTSRPAAAAVYSPEADSPVHTGAPAAAEDSPQDAHGHHLSLSHELEQRPSAPAEAAVSATAATDSPSATHISSVSQELQQPRFAPPRAAAVSAAASSPQDSHSQSLSLSQELHRFAPPAAAAPATGRLAPLEPLGPLRAGKLAPLAPIARGPGLPPPASSTANNKLSASSEGVQEELRRAGLLASPTGSSTGQLSTSNSPRIGDPAGATSSDRIVDGFVGLAAATSPNAAVHLGTAEETDSAADFDLDSDAERDLEAVAQSAAADYTAAAQNPNQPRPSAAAAMYGSAAGADFTSDDESSDDFGIEEQRQLFETARRHMLQQGQQQQAQPQQQQAAPAVQQQQHWDDDRGSEVHSDLDIPEDISLPLEGLEDDDDAYANMLEAARQQTGASAATAAADSAGNTPEKQQRASMSMGDTGISVYDRSGDISNLPSAADFVLDADDF